MTAVERIARVRISLQEIQPIISRLVEMPQTASLKGLHDVIQASFGWLDYHLYQFEIGGRRYGIPDPDLSYDPDVRWARNVKLGALIDKGHMRFGYVYDFGDEWRCAIAIEAVEDGVPGVDYPRLIAGERRGPPEDVDGVRTVVARRRDAPIPSTSAASDGRVRVPSRSKGCGWTRRSATRAPEPA